MVDWLSAIGKRTLIMGVLNVTPDSFSDGGLYRDQEKAIAHAKRMAEEGTDMIDVGGESTRPRSDPVLLQEELDRVIPVIEGIRKMLDIPISIDTYKAAVAEEALAAGANIVNDISALRFDERMRVLIAAKQVPVVLMHMQGTPKTMQDDPSYDDPVTDIISFFRERIRIAIEAGIPEEGIIIDPGIGFGKNLEHNLEILRRLSEFKVLKRPILLGTSRKSFISQISDIPVNERLEGTIASTVIGIMNGANIIRVHDIQEIRRAVEIADAIKYQNN